MEGWKQSSPSLRKKRPAFAVRRGGQSGVRHKRGPGGRLLDPSCELEALKCIMVREGYLSRVTRLVEDMARGAKRSRGKLQALPPGMVDLLDLLRVATLETVEAISLWRLSQVTPTPAPFEWNGHNYLMKMLQDCNFLDRVEALRSWLGFQVSGNPFLLPQQGSVDTDPDSGLTSERKSGPSFGFDKNGVADVGTQPWLGPLELDIVEGSEDVSTEKGTRPKKRKLRKTGAGSSLAPYAAAVVNDPTLLPAVKAPARAGLSNPDPFGLKNGPILDAPLGKAIVDIDGLVPNLVSREDTQRICVARQALLEEQVRVREAEEASHAGDGERDGRRRSRAQSTVSDEASSAARKHSHASASAVSGSPIKRKTSRFGPQTTPRNGSSVGVHRLRSRISPDPRGSPDMRSIVLTTAGLLHHPPAEPHPGLGPVLLQSHRPGGDSHPHPFLHTVSDAHSTQAEDLQPKIMIRAPNMADTSTMGRCSTAPLAASFPLREVDTQTEPRRPSVNHRRAATAPAKMPGASTIRSPSFSAHWLELHATRQYSPTPRAPCLGAATPSEEENRDHPGSRYSLRGEGLSRKAGAELRALTAAGTAGRRQPPPREVRLRRLARDVARHSAELRRLVREEEQLRKGLACCGGGDDTPRGAEIYRDLYERGQSEEVVEDSDVARMVAVRREHGGARTIKFSEVQAIHLGGPVKRVEAWLEDKRREIELKTFDLGLKRDELRCLRMVQKQERQRHLALEMERRRAHLNDGQRLPEDEKVAESLEDSACLMVQKRFRGNVGRTYAAWYKGNIQQAATTIQRGVRFIWDRRATRRRLLLNASARPMQAAVRMFVKRQRYKRLLRQSKELLATCKLQVVSRGMLGRKRAAARRSMIAAATRALDWVSLERLQPGHLKELARAIHGALVDPVRQFPPAGVLGALRVALTILDDAVETTNTEDADGVGVGCDSNNGRDMVTFETALGRTVRSAVSAPNLTWEMAARVLERPFRLLRRMRAFASGLGASSDSTPARLLHLSPKAAELLLAYRDDPSWSPEALSAVVEGGVAAKAFVGWAMELERVNREQPRVEAFLRDAQPAWLRKGRSFQKRRRALELHADACRQAVSVARTHRQHLEIRGQAYGDPVVATEVLQNQLDEAEEAVRQLERRRSAFLAAQAKVEEDAGRALREDVEFAEREASVAAREEEMALRLEQSGREELEALAGKVRDCGVVVRELERRLRVWVRRCREEKQPLLSEWIPPTEDQTRMSRALGEARAWQQIAAVRQARLVQAAGGRRFVKGLSGKDLEVWRSAVECLAACGADIESGQARLSEDLHRFERELSRANAEVAAEKVRSAPWDNATEDTQALERQEDADAARDERRTAMGATLPPGMLEDSSRRGAGGGRPSGGDSSRRPTLLLLGLDLPASIREGLRAGLDREAPDLFGGHVVGADALPSLASAAQTAPGKRSFFAPSREVVMQAAAPPISSNGAEDEPMPGALAPPRPGEQGRDEPNTRKRGTEGEPGEGTLAARTRANLVQAALSEGKNVSLEVVPGPGLWARGRFLRDLEALLGGLDDGGCDGQGSDACKRDRARKGSGPTVLLVDGHNRNRSGGGNDLSHGTKFKWKVAPQKEGLANSLKPQFAQRTSHEPEWALPTASLSARRVKALMEEAAQCLHDLGTTYGKAPCPFKAIETTQQVSLKPEKFRDDAGELEIRLDKNEPPGTPKPPSARDTATVRGRQNSSFVAEGSPGMELLLAVCHMLLHPDQRYDVGEGESEKRHIKTDSDVDTENAATLVYASRLAGTCRGDLAEKPSAQAVAETLRGAGLDAIPLETAVALRRLVRHPDWPAASPRPDFAKCCASEAFVGWIYAAVAGATELALEGGGGALRVGSGRGGAPGNEEAMDGWTKDQGLRGGVLGTRLAMGCGRSGSPLSLKDVYEQRRREQEVLREMEAALIDENVTVLDDDSPWVSQPETADDDVHVQDRRECTTSEVLNALMETALRPFNVFAESVCRIPASSPRPREAALSRRPEPELKQEDKFCVTISRAFGSVYARAVSLGTGRMRRGRAVMTRTREEDLVPLLSSNWMEKHDLSALRELRTEPAVWRALIDTLVLRHPDEAVPGPTDNAPHHARNALVATRTAGDTHRDKLAKRFSSPSKQGARRIRSPKGDGIQMAVLSFRHERRLTLETSCLLMGRAVAVSVFEESRSDFWCEAEVPAALISAGDAACPVGLRVPKECIPLILDDDHPMRMRAILDASDLRHLSVLIADRLKLCPIGPTRKGPRSYHYWLNDAIGGSSRPGNSEGSAGAGAAAAGVEDVKQLDEGESGRESKLSLRKRSIGQVVFSRLMSFWMPSTRMLETNKGGHRPSDPSLGHAVQRLVVVKEFAHRGECGELRGEVHNPDFGGEIDTLVLTPELTRKLLGDRLKEMRANDRNNRSCARYWRDALAWRLRIAPGPARGCGGNDERKMNETESFHGIVRTTPSSLTRRDDGVSRLTFDERKPLCALRRVAAEILDTPSTGEGGRSDAPFPACDVYFDVMLLLGHPESEKSAKPNRRRRTPAVELVATHRQTMTAFNFSVPAASLVKELDALVAACLTAPTALSTELELSTSSTAALGGLAAKWLQYTTADSPSGQGPTLVLNLARTKPVVTEPYVSFRCSGGEGATNRVPHEAYDEATTTEAGPSSPIGGGEPHRRHRSRETRRSMSGSGPRGTRKSIATLRVDTRNERMVFRRSLAVPRSGYLAEPARKEGFEELEPKVLSVSVYEAFTVGSAGRIERHLRFCARDESVRPVVEAATTIPWVGTSEGIEGGRLWRVVTQGLSFECARDKTGKCVGMWLNVATEDKSEERIVSHHAAEAGRQRTSPPTSLLSPKGDNGEEDGRAKTEPKVTSGNRHGAGKSKSETEATAMPRNSETKLEQEHSGIEHDQTSSRSALGKIGDANVLHPLEDDIKAAAVVGSQEQKIGFGSPIDVVHNRVPDRPANGRRDVGLYLHGARTRTDQVTKVYSGWHRVTGIRLHIQCFQESKGSAGGVADVAARATPAGRGGAVGLPRDATLRFLVCDPSNGRRTGINVSVDEVCRNLSVDGGIVEARLLDAGRRSALARAIAEKLRLVFEAGGGYTVVLPLPATWSRTGQQAG